MSMAFGSTSASSFDNCTLKLADFGLAKDYKKSRGNHTEYVSTRWYRAPELVLRQQNYSEKIDIFALGCIMGELFLGRPIFPGTSESDQLTRIVTVLGAPSRQEWPEGLETATRKGISFPMVGGQSLKQHLSGSVKNELSDDAIDLLQKMFKYNSEERISAR